jgi:putative oxidoreductase
MSTFDIAMLVLRLGIGLIFVVHGGQKLFGWWGGPGMAGWRGAMAHMGFRPAGLFAWTSAIAEFGGGLALMLGVLTPLAAAVLIAQSVVIIGQAHWRSGFLSRDGGYEFPLALGAGSAAVLLAGAGQVSVDAMIGFQLTAGLVAALFVLGVVGGFVALGVPRLTQRASQAGGSTERPSQESGAGARA